jgi:hypothetical protein
MTAEELSDDPYGTMIVPGRLNIEERIVRGRYDLVSKGFLVRFLKQYDYYYYLAHGEFPAILGRRWKWRIFAAPSGFRVTTDGMVGGMRTMGYEPAAIEQLLTLGETKPDLQKQLRIVALGSSCRVGGYHKFPVLFVDHNGRRTLSLASNIDGDYWRRTRCFLGVRIATA